MKVHIVSRDATADNILGRLVRDLLSHTDWTVGEKPNPTADLQYYFPYLEWSRHRDFRKTATAAWFSHLDISRSSKVEVWNDVASNVTIRTTSARMYLDALQRSGDSFLVTPPLDMNKFQPAPHRKRRRPLVGTSGFVYPGGRKGEKLIAQLARSPLDIALSAAGHGWPVATTNYAWDDLPQFYQGLDVYLCTSLIEGIGYGPLEAMACGIPTVIPRGVGVFDELPDVQNLFRYEAGDYASMALAVQRALNEPVNVESLRGVVTRFTSDAWLNSHTEAFRRFDLAVSPVPKKLPPWKGRAGVFYVAYGKQARDCAQRAIVSFHDHMPGVPVALVSDKPIGIEDVFIQHSDDDIGARSVKTLIYDLAPAEWDYVLYLDADTEVTADIGFIFELLSDGWEFVICYNPAQYVLAREMQRPDNKDEMEETVALLGTDEILQFNGGVFAFRRNERTRQLLNVWHSEWDRYGKRDQAAFDRALYTYPVRVFTLGNEWNTITRYIPAERTAGILHYPMTARRWKGRINGRLDRPEAWANVYPERDSHADTRNDGGRNSLRTLSEPRRASRSSGKGEE